MKEWPLTLKWVGAILSAENWTIKRLLIEGPIYTRLLDDARTHAASGKTPPAPLDPVSLYRRLYAKALEDGRIEPMEQGLLEAIAEALLLTPEEIARIERSQKIMNNS